MIFPGVDGFTTFGNDVSMPEDGFQPGAIGKFRSY